MRITAYIAAGFNAFQTFVFMLVVLFQSENLAGGEVLFYLLSVAWRVTAACRLNVSFRSIFSYSFPTPLSLYSTLSRSADNDLSANKMQSFDTYPPTPQVRLQRVSVHRGRAQGDASAAHERAAQRTRSVPLWGQHRILDTAVLAAAVRPVLDLWPEPAPGSLNFNSDNSEEFFTAAHMRS